jgi:type IV pilus assembly protein PilE
MPYASVPQARRGFTLIEVMITVAILAILAAVALPAYFDSVRKARRSDAIGAISKAQQAQERYRANNATYGNSFTGVGTASFGAASGATATFDSENAYYTVDVPANSATGYTLRAYAKSGTSQAKDKNCQCLQLAASGGQFTYSAGGSTGTTSGTAACGSLTSGAAANQCWRK